MKNFILILIFTTTNFTYAQNWNYKSGGNAFDGKYKTASVLGKGTDYPYNKPLLVINLFNEESLNFYIADAGFYQTLSDIEILWIFNNDSNNLYKSYDFTKSEDGKILFLDDFKNATTGDYLYKLEFVEKLKSANKVDVRIQNKYGKNDITFSLSGSTKAIDYVISKKYKDEVIAYNKEIKKIAKEQMEKTVEINSGVLLLLRNAGITNDKEWTDIFEKIDNTFDLYDLEMSEIDSLNFVISKYSTDLYLFKNDGELIKEIKYVDNLIPKYIENLKKIENQNKSELIFSLLERYQLTTSEKNIVITEIIDKSKYLFDINKLDSLNLIVVLNRSSLDLFNKKEGKLYNFDYFQTVIPEYVKRTSLEIKNNAIERINSLLKKYELTKSEKDKIFKELADIYLYEIEVYKADKATIENYPYVTRIKFLNASKEIHEVSINGADFSKQLKKKIKKLNLN